MTWRLKRRYRDRLRDGNPGMVFLYLKGSFDVIMERLKARSGHFMPTDLLKSQFDALEEPGSDEPDVLWVDIDADIDNVVQRCVLALQSRS